MLVRKEQYEEEYVNAGTRCVALFLRDSCVCIVIMIKCKCFALDLAGHKRTRFQSKALGLKFDMKADWKFASLCFVPANSDVMHFMKMSGS